MKSSDLKLEISVKEIPIFKELVKVLTDNFKELPKVVQDKIKELTLVEIKKDYTKICPTCYHFGKDGTCDMCAWGDPIAIDNNNLTPEQVKKCDYK